MQKTLGSLVAAAILTVPAIAAASTWEIDPSHSNAQFSVRHLMVSNVKGDLGKVTGTVELDDKDPTKSKVDAKIETAGINTREAKRDEHLKSDDFFNAAKFPHITFKSKKIEKAGDNKFKVTGDLTIRDVTKEVVLDAETSPTELKDPYGNIKRGLTATTTINRKDYGLKWNAAVEGGGVVVGDEVKVTIDVELTKKVAKKS